jgi:hypothetical protein
MHVPVLTLWGDIEENCPGTSKFITLTEIFHSALVLSPQNKDYFFCTLCTPILEYRTVHE